MERHESEETLSALIDGELSGPEAAAAAAHLSSCAVCRSRFAGLGSARQFLRMAPRRPMPPGLAADLQRRVDDLPPRPAFTPWARPWLPALGFAAAALLAGVWVWRGPGPSGPEIPIEQLMAAHERYRDEGLLAAADPAQADFTATLAATEETLESEDSDG